MSTPTRTVMFVTSTSGSFDRNPTLSPAFLIDRLFCCMGGAASIGRGDADIIGTPVGAKKRQASELTKANSVSVEGYPTFDVALGFWPGKTVALPDYFRLRVSYESLDFIKMEDDSPLIQFPFQNIICWGSSRQNFQFKVFDFENTDVEKKDMGILISLKSTQGRLIEDATMSTVQKLMVDMNQYAISKVEFTALQGALFDEENLREDWKTTILQFTTGGRRFLAKQGMELLIRVGNVAPFEKFDLACVLYENIINKDSFQLLVNTFPDELERENLIHRLKLHSEVVKNCTILPEKSESRAT